MTQEKLNKGIQISKAIEHYKGLKAEIEGNTFQLTMQCGMYSVPDSVKTVLERYETQIISEALHNIDTHLKELEKEFKRL